MATIFCLAMLTQVPRPSREYCFCVKQRDVDAMPGHMEEEAEEEEEEEGGGTEGEEGVGEGGEEAEGEGGLAPPPSSGSGGGGSWWKLCGETRVMLVK